MEIVYQEVTLLTLAAQRFLLSAEVISPPWTWVSLDLHQVSGEAQITSPLATPEAPRRPGRRLTQLRQPDNNLAHSRPACSNVRENTGLINLKIDSPGPHTTDRGQSYDR